MNSLIIIILLSLTAIAAASKFPALSFENEQGEVLQIGIFPDGGPTMTIGTPVIPDEESFFLEKQGGTCGAVTCGSDSLGCCSSSTNPCCKLAPGTGTCCSDGCYSGVGDVCCGGWACASGETCSTSYGMCVTGCKKKREADEEEEGEKQDDVVSVKELDGKVETSRLVPGILPDQNWVIKSNAAVTPIENPFLERQGGTCGGVTCGSDAYGCCSSSTLPCCRLQPGTGTCCSDQCYTGVNDVCCGGWACPAGEACSTTYGMCITAQSHGSDCRNSASSIFSTTVLAIQFILVIAACFIY